MAIRLIVTFSVIAVVLPGYAQDANESASMALEEVIVTATKRSTSLQDVPISVSVVSGDFLSKLRESDINTLVQYAPNLSWQDGRESKVRAFNIRGIGTASFVDGIEDSVGIVVDGVPLGRAAMGLYDMFDIDHVEVLRGPQGYLFGRSSSAGVVSIITKSPNMDEFEANGTLSYGQYDTVTDAKEWKFDGALSGPIGDSVGFRIAVFGVDRDGWVRDVWRNKDDWTKKQKAVRAKLRVEPNENFDATISVDYLKQDSECCADIGYLITNPTGRLATLVTPLLPAGKVIDENNQYIAQNARSGNTNKVGGVSLEMNYMLGDHTLTSITAFRKWDSYKETDEDKSPDNFFDFTSTDTTVKQITQELRLASPTGEGPLEYLFGINFYNQNLDSLEVFSGEFSTNPPEELHHSESPINIDQTSIGLFTSGTFHMSDQWALLFGLRWTYDDLHGTVKHTETGPIVIFPIVDINESDTDGKLTGKLGVQYQATDDVMLFASYSTGYKGQAFNSNSINTLGLDSYIVPGEKAKSAELGMKSRWLDSRLQLNATVFHTSFEDFQAQSLIYLPGAGVPSSVLSSVKKLETQGLELDMTVSVTDELLVGASFGYTDATFENYRNSPCYTAQSAEQGCVGSVQTLDGERLPFQGKTQYNVFFDYDKTFSGGWTFFTQGNFSWVDKRNTLWTLDPIAEVGSVGLLSARVGARFYDDRVEVALFGSNLTNETYKTAVRYSGFGGGYFMDIGAPRFIGVSVSLNY